MVRFSPGSFSDLQETTARIPALSRLLQGNGILTASGLILKTTVKRQRVRKRKRKVDLGVAPHIYGLSWRMYANIGQCEEGMLRQYFQFSEVGEVMHFDCGCDLSVWREVEQLTTGGQTRQLSPV